MVPFCGYSPNSFAGLLATSRTNVLTSIRPCATPSLNMIGSREPSPGTPFGIIGNGALPPRARLPFPSPS